MGGSLIDQDNGETSQIQTKNAQIRTKTQQKASQIIPNLTNIQRKFSKKKAFNIQK